MSRTKAKRIDLREIRLLPILTVAESLGIPLMRTGSGAWAMKDPERPREPTSLQINESRNRWKRWSGKTSGGVSEGSVIDLVMHYRDCSFEDAVDFLTSRFF